MSVDCGGAAAFTATPHVLTVAVPVQDFAPVSTREINATDTECVSDSGEVINIELSSRIK